MIRPFAGVQTVGAASQPLFGTTMNGAGTMQKDPHTNNVNPGSQDSYSILPVASTKGFEVGDRVLIGPKANFVFRGTLDQGTVIGVAAGVSLTVKGLISTHASGEYVVLNEDAVAVFLYPATMTAGYYLGTDSTVAAGDASVFFAGATGQPYSSLAAIADTQKTSQYWINATPADTFIASYTQA